MIRELEDYTNQLTDWQKAKRGLKFATSLLKKGTYIIKERTSKIGREYAVFLNYEAYQNDGKS